MTDLRTLTRDDVVWCYETLLHRQPESEAVIENFLATFDDKESLARFFVRTEEFRARIVSPIELTDFAYTDAEETQRAILPVLRALEPRKARGIGKIRVGGAHDGGYVMLDDLDGMEAAYSLGIGDEVTWDLEIADRGIDVLQYDHTIEKAPVDHPRFRWYKRGIGAKDDEVFTTIARELDAHGHRTSKDLLLKCDIEGWEWQVLASMDPSVLSGFRQIVMEMHGFQLFYRPDVCRRAARAVEVLTANHAVVHVHANNNSAYAIVGGVPVPAALEVTLVRRDVAELVENDETFPTELDVPASQARADFFLGLFRF